MRSKKMQKIGYKGADAVEADEVSRIGVQRLIRAVGAAILHVLAGGFAPGMLLVRWLPCHLPRLPDTTIAIRLPDACLLACDPALAYNFSKVH